MNKFEKFIVDHFDGIKKALFVTEISCTVVACAARIFKICSNYVCGN